MWFLFVVLVVVVVYELVLSLGKRTGRAVAARTKFAPQAEVGGSATPVPPGRLEGRAAGPRRAARGGRQPTLAGHPGWYPDGDPLICVFARSSSPSTCPVPSRAGSCRPDSARVRGRPARAAVYPPSWLAGPGARPP